MDFSNILALLRSGNIKNIYRSGWGGKNIVVYLHYPSSSSLTKEQLENDVIVSTHFRIYNKETKRVDAWIPSVPDILAYDWEISKE